MGNIDQANRQIEELNRKIAAMGQERNAYLQDRIVIALTTPFEVENHSLEMLMHLRENMQITFSSSDFAVLSFAGTETDPDRLSATPIWNTLVSPRYLELRNIILSVINLRHVGLTCDNGGKILCILNFAPQTGDYYEELKSLNQQINQLAEDRWGVSLQLSASELGSGIASLPELRRQISVLDDYRTTMCGHAPQLLFYDQVVSPAQTYPIYVKTMNDQFNEYLESGEFARAKQFFRKTIIDDFINSPPPVNMIRFRLSALIDYLIQALHHTCNVLGIQDLIRQTKLPETLLVCTSIEELADRMDGIFDLLSANWSLTGSTVLKLAQDARSFMNENYMNPNLNVNLVATQLNVTTAHLTRSFQACYGCGVLDYIQHLRLAAAKDLLDSGLNFREIALKTGYGSALNMSRAFKRYEGKTPTEYLSDK